jgi:hypothetical protein
MPRQALKSISAGARATKGALARVARLTTAFAGTRIGKASVSRTMLYLSSAVVIVAVSFMVLSPGRENGTERAPENLPPVFRKAVFAPRPGLPAVPLELLGAVSETKQETDGAPARRKVKVSNVLPVSKGDPVGPGPEPAASSFRREYRSLDEAEIVRMVTARNFFDARKNPDGGFAHRYRTVNAAGLTLIVDRAANLVWTHQRPAVKMNLEKTGRWIESLNRFAYGGIRSWRLPTVEEAASLLRKSPGNESHFLDDVFGGDLQAIWTGDGVGGSGNWIVDFDNGVIDNAKSRSRLMALMVSSDAGPLGEHDPLLKNISNP